MRSALPLRRLLAVAVAIVVTAAVNVAPRSDADAIDEYVVVVDGGSAGALNSNPGTPEQPVATIARGVALAQAANVAGRPARVVIRPGVYRESVKIRKPSEGTDAALVIEGAGADQVVIDGADVWTNWQPVAATNIVTKAWPHTWGLTALPSGWSSYFADNDVSDLARRREIVWVNGQVLRQVLTAAELQPGTFTVDEGAGTVSLYPPAGVDPDTATIEVSVRDRNIDVENVANFTLRGVTSRRAATPLEQASARFSATPNLVIEDARFDWNNWQGLALQNVVGAQLRRLSTSSNGVMGLNVYRSENVTVTDVNNSYNNTWRGPWAGYFGWATGAKVFRARNITFDRWYAVGNKANGLWLDTDVANASVRNSFFGGNLRRGLFLEALQGPVSVTNNTVCNNADYGVVDGKSDNVTLTGNRLFGNDEAQLVFSGSAGGRSFTAYDTNTPMTIRSVNWTVRDNILEGKSGARVTGNHLNATDWGIVRASLNAGGNRYHHATDARPFTLPGKIVDLAGWRGGTGQDATATLSTATAGLTCAAQPPPVPAAPAMGAPPAEEPTPGPSPEPVPTLHLSAQAGGTTTMSQVITRTKSSKTGSSWTAEVSVRASRSDGTNLSGVVVAGQWSYGATQSTCTTDRTGVCVLRRATIKTATPRLMTLTVTSAARTGYAIAPGVLPLVVRVSR